jgi:uroporphyrinogen decarboxylase
VALYLNAQVAAGAQALMIFDTWGGALSPSMYREFSLKYMSDIVAGLSRENEGRKVPVILFTKGGGQWLNDMADSGCDALGLDWTTDISLARQQVGNRVALQGNMDPSTLHASPEVIRNEVAAILAAYGKGSGHVFNLGHGITPEIDPEHVSVLVNAVHELSAPYHSAD